MSLTKEVLVKAGILIGISSYYGIGDLHNQNIAIGYIKNTGQLICSPLDIECIFNLCRLPSQTLLIPSAFSSFQNCGLERILSLFPSDSKERHSLLIYLIYGFLRTIILINKSQMTAALLQSTPEDSPIRVIIKDTQIYYDYTKGINAGPFLSSELAQLARGDIPFYFRRIFSKQIRWLNFDSSEIWDNSSDLENIEMHKDSEDILETYLLNSNHPYYNDLLHASPLQIIRNIFPATNIHLKSTYKGYILETDSNKIEITNDEGFKWSCKY